MNHFIKPLPIGLFKYKPLPFLRFLTTLYKLDAPEAILPNADNPANIDASCNAPPN
jgi:hypothetical protein